MRGARCAERGRERSGEIVSPSRDGACCPDGEGRGRRARAPRANKIVGARRLGGGEVMKETAGGGMRDQPGGGRLTVGREAEGAREEAVLRRDSFSPRAPTKED